MSKKIWVIVEGSYIWLGAGYFESKDAADRWAAATGLPCLRVAPLSVNVAFREFPERADKSNGNV